MPRFALFRRQHVGEPKPRLTGASDSRPLKLFLTVPIISGISMSMIWSMIQVLSLSPISSRICSPRKRSAGKLAFSSSGNSNSE